MSLFNELKRRNVFKVAAAYLIVGWLILQVGEVLSPALHLPEWANSILAFFIILGFPFALIFAWAFEMTPEGLKKEKDIDRSQSITQATGQKLNFSIIALLVVALGYFAVDKFVLAPQKLQPDAVQSAPQDEGTRSIAVLPLADMSAEGDNEYFADGLSEELLNFLAKIKKLRVAGRTSSFAFKGQNEDLREIGQKLNVETILEGSVRKDDARNRVRITLQLVDVENGFHLWSETYDRDLDDIFAIQEEVAEQVTRALRVALLGEDETPVPQVATTDYSAYDLYLHGLQALNEFSYASLEKAAKDFQQALALDPDYIPAQVGLIKAWQSLANTGALTRKEAVDRSLPLLRMVLQEEPENVEANLLMGWVHLRNRDRHAAEAAYRKAVESSPRHVEALNELGSFLRDSERLDEGLPYTMRAAQLDPYSVQVQWDLCWLHTWTAELDRALEACGKIRDIEPNNPMGYYGPSLAYAVAGDLAQSVAWDMRAVEVDPDDYELQAELADYWLNLGDPKMAEKWLQRAQSTGADKPQPLASQVDFLQFNEQVAMAAQLAATTLQMDDRRNSRNRLRNAYARHAVSQGNFEAALESYRIDHPWMFQEPLEIRTDTRSWNSGELVEMAYVLKLSDFTSPLAEQLLDAAESAIDGGDPNLAPWMATINRAGLEAVRGNRAEALALLREAYDQNFRYQWRYTLQYWFVLDDLRKEPEFREIIALYESDMERQRERTYALLEAGP